jgi:hypothetical protein
MPPAATLVNRTSVDTSVGVKDSAVDPIPN